MNRATFISLLAQAALPAAPQEVYVFSFFRNNGEDGLYLAASEDGLKWSALNGGLPLLQPTVGESKLMRDPSIARGPDGTFHMVWTTSWKGRTIGHATSKDLRTWSAQHAIEVFPKTTEVLNCWAPEIFYDEPSRGFVVVWASTLGGTAYAHRLYSFRTKDFKRLSAAKLFYDPGRMVIDGALFRDGSRYAMVVKDETPDPPAKHLFLTYAEKLEGPWTAPSANISGKEWAEGASPMKVGEWWMIYFDKYRDHRYGAIRSKDLKVWEDVSDRMEMPKGARHGTVFRAPSDLIAALR